MKTPTDFNFKNKTVLIRCDFNISFDEKGNVLDDLRVRESIPTILEVINGGGKAVLIGHTSEGKTLKDMIPLLEGHLKKKIEFISKTGQEMSMMIKEASWGDILLLENLRLFDGEEENSEHFASELAITADFFINEAFSVCHRNHASVVRLPDLLPHCAGFGLVQEIKALSRVRDNPERPIVTIIGGAKVASKIKVVETFLEKSDSVLLGGKLANEILIIKGIIKDKPWPDEEVIKEIENVKLTSNKIHLPVDLIVDGEYSFRIVTPNTVKTEEEIYDIGPETVKIFSKIISEARMIIWAGPLGFFEDKKYEKGTREIAQAIAMNRKAFKVIGGGDTGIALTKFHLRDSMDHISTGGGAMLDFIAGKKLPGLKALGYYDEN